MHPATVSVALVPRLVAAPVAAVAVAIIAAVGAMLLVAPIRPSAEAAPAGDPFEQTRQAMVEEQIADREVTTPRVLDAMRVVPRHRFVPPEEIPYAYDDRPLPIGYGQTISQPYIVALMTDLLAIEPGQRVLEVGTGSGYQAAILAALGATVYSMEIVPELAAAAAERLHQMDYGSVTVREGDGYFGWPEKAPFQAIIVTCAADHIPPPLLQQLAPGGRMCLPVGGRFSTQDLVLVLKDREGRVSTRSVLPVRFVPLTRKN